MDFFVAYVSFVGFLVTVLRCLRRLDVTVGHTNVTTCVTLWKCLFTNVPSDNVHSFPWPAELRSLYTCLGLDVSPC